MYERITVVRQDLPKRMPKTETRPALFRRFESYRTCQTYASGLVFAAKAAKEMRAVSRATK
ncbi:hypothetical protein ESZ91_05395 [Candidatus Borkfalkia ceftriaxoniphila]|uniref:Uncharacterized protein n=1 Tax=Candidatus Borkfalkia ceftriaxoniphila TaxID=2508949 RepID=A0A4Q2KB81_9FIRM|nr:hypothetical protein [Candidatus Borkfalkia ceftriaxoniphila]RXZ61825.1 hypothetical protein ESZ91_05395 [Candidatus Borkfalkia ceftriaxoniphila]